MDGKMANKSLPENTSRRQAVLPPSLPWKIRLNIWLIDAIASFARRPNGTINRRLFSFFDPQASANPNPVDGVRSTDLTVEPSRGLWLRLFTPAGECSGRRPPVIVFFHGGGFVFLSPSSRSYDSLFRRICRSTGAAVVAPSYSLLPEHRFPEPYDDGLAALRFLESADLNLDLSTIFIAGDSAGGNIAHHVALRWSSAAAASDARARVRIAGIIAIQPFFGGEERTESEIRLNRAPMVSMKVTDWTWKAFLPEGADRNHEAAHVTAAAVEKGFPVAAMVVVGGYDPLQDWQRRYAETLRRGGKEVEVLEFPDTIHYFYAFEELGESQKLLEEIKGFLEKYRFPKGVDDDDE
ncbi:probable carboxylesterase 18 [Typha latifolia]|uniref:probable carboxylesterase 18 n=1 Tax=Typha latifolia TaxID=4733 RepID=UPI003C2F383E